MSNVQELIGKTAVVYLPILPGESGKISVMRGGTDELMFARGIPGSVPEDGLSTGTKVLITDLLDSSTVAVQPI